MDTEQEIFKRYLPDFKKITEYGFSKKETGYYLEKIFMDGEFKAVIEVSASGEVMGNVYDLENDELYLPLRIEAQKGGFSGKVKAEYEYILNDICEKCFIKKNFIFNQTNRIAKAIYEKYGNTPEFLWEKAPGCGVFRHKDNNKWYGIIMNVDYSKLDGSKSGEVEIMNLKLDENEICELLKKKGFFKAWHMNKKSWITLILDETLTDKEIMKYVEESFVCTGLRKKK